MFLVHICMILLFFFFFKQKTAYEMRISDWSSDVCSSDLASPTRNGPYLCGGGPFALRMIRCGRRFESLPSRYLTCREGQGAVRQVGVGKDVALGAAAAFSAPYAAILLQLGTRPASTSSAAYRDMDWQRRLRHEKGRDACRER